MQMAQPAASYTPCDDLWCITTYFNPAHFSSRRENYEVFADRFRRSGIHLVTIECAFGDDPFELPSTDEIRRVRSHSVLWQKERLINLALSCLPSEAHKVAWLDCDIVFADPGWAVNTAQLLTQYRVVQPFQLRIKLLQGSGLTDEQDPPLESFAYRWGKDRSLKGKKYRQHGSTGFAWAARKDVIQKHGLYDACLSGVGDDFIAHAMCGDWNGLCIRDAMRDPPAHPVSEEKRSRRAWKIGRRLAPEAVRRALRNLPPFSRQNEVFRRHYARWARAFYKDIQGRLGCTPGVVLHLWHGSSQNRGYIQGRWDLNAWGFNPDTDLRIDSSGCWEWASEKPALHQWAEEAFRRRKEDGG
jgi:hypothetical protein